jgi:p24 family protein beta-1
LYPGSQAFIDWHIVFTMRFTTSSILLAASCLLGTAAAHNIQLAAHGRECFHESLHKDDKMTVTFQVGDREFGSAGNLDVDFWVGIICVSSLAHC